MRLVVVGAQWGDEGKGKIVDYLSAKTDIVLRFSGGANAGHTIVHDDVTYKLHLLPSGIIYPTTMAVLGSGMVIDPKALFDELDMLKELGIGWEDRVFISDRAHLVLPSYAKEDAVREAGKRFPIGTTGRGIGDSYAHKAYRDGIRIADLTWEEHLSELDTEDTAFLMEYKDRLLSLSIDVVDFLQSKSGKRILFEGAQGTLLDIDLGTYPYVSSGSSSAAGTLTGAGIGMKTVDHILGVFKAYSTRVGNGPFPTELNNESEGRLEEHIRETGREYGVTTGRARRVGYLDLVALRYASITNGFTHLALTHLDVYDEIPELSACVAYETEEEVLEYFPASMPLLEQAKPVLKKFKGWNQNIGKIRTFDALPKEAQEYISFIEEYIGVPISIISVGYEREQTITHNLDW